MQTRQRLSYIKDQIKERISVKDAIAYYFGIEITRKNISCIFHEDKNPSMSVDNEVFYCHSCHVGGDVIKLVQEYYKLSFKEAIIKLDTDFKLGLTGERISVTQQIKLRKQKQEKERIEAEKQAKEKQEREYLDEYRLCHEMLVSGELEPFSEVWCYYQERKTQLEQYI